VSGLLLVSPGAIRLSTVDPISVMLPMFEVSAVIRIRMPTAKPITGDRPLAIQATGASADACHLFSRWYATEQHSIAAPARTSRTITDPAALLRDLELAAARGYAIDDEEDADGVFCVGAAVHDRAGKCVAAISGTGLKLNRPTWRMDELGAAIRNAADQITLALGGTAFAGRQAR
jgi:Bacterial transcriptional regulator